MTLTICPEGAQFIEDQEADPYISAPDWPGGDSGVTIGYGYDLGQNSANAIRNDWAALPAGIVTRLCSYAGRTGAAAKTLIPGARDIIIPQDVARDVFLNTDMPRACDQTEAVFSRCDQLPPMAFAMLVSLVFNRGPSLIDPPNLPNQRLEMRQIAESMAAGNFVMVPFYLRRMERLWPGVPDLQRRRNLEADNFAAALLTQG